MLFKYADFRERNTSVYSLNAFMRSVSWLSREMAGAFVRLVEGKVEEKQLGLIGGGD